MERLLSCPFSLRLLRRTIVGEDFEIEGRLGSRFDSSFVLGKNGRMGVPPPPWVYWNHRLSVKTQNNLWAAITCGQNLERQGVRSQTSAWNSLADFAGIAFPWR